MARPPSKNARHFGDKPMKVLIATYQMAFHTPGSGEVQLSTYKKHLPALGLTFHYLIHEIRDSSCTALSTSMHACVRRSSYLCAFVEQLGLPLVVSSSLWITEQTKDQHPLRKIRAQPQILQRSNAASADSGNNFVISINFTTWSGT